MGLKHATSQPADRAQRDRFREEWGRNFAVSANAGSGKTTAISERLAAIAQAPEGADILKRTAVVTFTRKAAGQIAQRARAVLVRRLAEAGRGDIAPLDHLERAFFGTIHSFCLVLAQRHGQALGLNLNPSVVETAEQEDALWEEFLEQDEMQFRALDAAWVDAFLRHAPLESIFGLARQLDRITAARLMADPPAAPPPEPSETALVAILAAQTRGRAVEILRRNQQNAQRWLESFRSERTFLPLIRPEGTAAGIEQLYAAFFAPVKEWLARAGGVLAGELALRFRAWRFERGVQTYADQIDTALAVMQDPETLDQIRREGWRIILDEAQDTDPQQFAVLVEVARPPGAPIGTWPEGRGAPPRAGHFCMVGDGQQSIYGSRADVRNFSRHLEAFARGDGGELLRFSVTFRSPHRVIDELNRTLAPSFGLDRVHNSGVGRDGRPGACLQVAYEPLVAADGNEDGAIATIPIVEAPADTRVDARLGAEVRQLAEWLGARGPAGVGARHWGEVCILAPRNDWLLTARKELERAGLATALQMRRSRCGEHPVYAWVTGLLATVCDPENHYETVGVLREIFGVSDAFIAAEFRSRPFSWDDPALHAAPIREALEVLQRLAERVDLEGESLAEFAEDLVESTGLRAKAAAIDTAGGGTAELERLVGRAVQLGLEGGGPRDWRRELLREIDTGRPDGQPREEAINLLTAHSAKGLEWPVVIPIGLWRSIGRFPEEGMRLVPAEDGRARVYFDRTSLPADTREARERERLRELVRLLYVTLTRARRALILPLGMAAEESSFLDLWGADLGALPAAQSIAWPEPPPEPRTAPAEECRVEGDQRRLIYPRRLLPHQLTKADAVRVARHESVAEEPAGRSLEDPLEYGTWWHETLETLPWRGADAEVQAHVAIWLEGAARRGLGDRAREELERLIKSPVWTLLREPRWTILTELSIVAPLESEAGWVDGVVDLVAHDPGARELLIVDWKTNRLPKGQESAELLGRLRAEYAGQVEAYRACVAPFFPETSVRVALYSTAAGDWVRW